jgi:hypothetical protein
VAIASASRAPRENLSEAVIGKTSCRKTSNSAARGYLPNYADFTGVSSTTRLRPVLTRGQPLSFP